MFDKWAMISDILDLFVNSCKYCFAIVVGTTIAKQLGGRGGGVSYQRTVQYECGCDTDVICKQQV